MRCTKSQKLYNMATVPLQICNGTDRCCKNFIVLYSLFSLLSLHFFFSLLSHSLVPSLFSLYWFPLSSTSPRCSPATTTVQLRRRQRAPPPLISHARSHPRSSHARSHPRSSHARSHSCLAMLDLTLRPPSISPSSLSSLFAFHSASLQLWVFFFFLAAIWVDLMVVVGRGLWAVTVAVVVGCGGGGCQCC